ncbi:MAG: 2-dehydro-3-deoxygalactonokinase, partial [Gemmatimonadota bacterium]|nr:2-dehydro-3-deoxygalactonokinase [Gemmatimonadota bacterium]
MATETSPRTAPGALIALDWGTSMLRAYLIDATGTVTGERAEPWGIMQLGARDFASACREVTTQWSSAAELPVIASGMVGSANGWVEAPYCAAPAGVCELAAALRVVPGAPVHIVPGVSQRIDAADVMRGEETQAIGALALNARFRDDALLIFPGTHSKWVHVRNDRISTFNTYMTGELFAVLRDHSILGRLADASPVRAGYPAANAFALGVRTARDSRRGTEALLFSARSRVLLGDMAAEVSLEYLSGIIIGGELQSALDGEAKP